MKVSNPLPGIYLAGYVHHSGKYYGSSPGHVLHFRLQDGIHSDNYYSSSSGGAGPLAGAGRPRPAAGSGTKAPMRQPHETLRDLTHMSEAHTRFDLLCDL